jgi:hypothetical protein
MRLRAAPEDVKDQLTHHHMVHLADLFEGWALDEKVSRENSAYFLGLQNPYETWPTKWDLIGVRPNPRCLASSAIWCAGGSVSEIGC